MIEYRVWHVNGDLDSCYDNLSDAEARVQWLQDTTCDDECEHEYLDCYFYDVCADGHIVR